MSDEIKIRKKSRLTSKDTELVKTTDFESPEELYERLISTVKEYHPSDDISMIEKAYRIARDAHKDQMRKSGEPYIIHPLCVALILADLELDKESIVGGLLHDVVEDTVMTEEDIAREFSPEVALIVSGVTKLGKLEYQGDKIEVQAENLRKMFLAMAKDIRVILIKLADRLHNMRTMKFMKPEKQIEKSRETMDIYAPIAQRLGIAKIKIELDDLALRYLEPDVYYDLARQINLKRDAREAFVSSIVDEVYDHMKEGGIECEVNGRVKHFFSIYKKMVNQNKTLDEIYDLFAVRILVNSVQDCYAALGLIHSHYTPVPGRFKDYIAIPKDNMYQSLHTTLIGKTGQPFEIQIRTYDMHRTAEYGIAAHWKYKEAPGKKNVENREEAKLTWLRQILEWQTDSTDNREFMNLIKDDLNLYTDKVYCFTPTGDVKNLPNGSTPIDFAYHVHSAVGNKMVGARVNGKLVNIDYVLKNGDRVDILTSANSKGPSRDWLNIVKSSQARNKINQWFKNEFKEENIIRGKESLDRYCKAKGIDMPPLMKAELKEKVFKKYGFHDWDAVCAAVGHGGLKEGQVINKLQEEYLKANPKKITDEEAIAQAMSSKDNEVRKNLDSKKNNKKSKTVILVNGQPDLMCKLMRCCNPVPGDEIVGYLTRGRGISIHRSDCVNVLHFDEIERTRLTNAVEWADDADKIFGSQFTAELKIFLDDKVGTMVKVMSVFTDANINIENINTHKTKDGYTTLMISFNISGVRELKKIIEKIRQLSCVRDVERTAG